MATYLAKVFDPARKGFPGREFYGLAFAIWLWSYWPAQYRKEIDAAANLLEPQRLQDEATKYHWEFVRFALSYAFRNVSLIGEKSRVRDLLGDERFAYTRVANWTLLRSTVRTLTLSKFQKFISFFECIFCLIYYQKRCGFIEDEKGKPSLQYHAFSTALLGLQIVDGKVKDAFIRRRFRRALEVLNILCLPGGEVNYIGRGQYQSFGYASAILAFSVGAYIFNDHVYVQKARDVLARLANFRRSDGSLPLVLGSCEMENPILPDLLDPIYVGWYSYNNYYDYLPFTGALLRKAADILGQYARTKQSNVEDSSTRSELIVCGGFRVITKPKYVAVLQAPARAWASWQPLPYLWVSGEYPLPCYGGEQDAPSLYSPEGIPLPVLIDEAGRKISLVKGASFHWTSPFTLVGKQAGVSFHRTFSFETRRISVIDRIALFGKMRFWTLHSPRLLLASENVTQVTPCLIRVGRHRVRSSVSLYCEDRPYFNASGVLQGYYGIPKACVVRDSGRVEYETRLTFELDL
ncbi:hypothetical protein GQ464_012955 [Rhodocaloribacter litoris]|uniref:hypothetical protein n=1 Tax=Rhodocaloribacter litoris TaxID=2558931 RepID=UPI00141E2890|nr:hypothetical protein [Rhodocaloribacter litoris]QXD14342.1 hypothetical protein GQ464_012955 [Rhodocaloribacter litoris]